MTSRMIRTGKDDDGNTEYQLWVDGELDSTFETFDDAKEEMDDQNEQETAEENETLISDYLSDLDPSTPIGRARLAYLAEIVRKMQ